jgi:hypothetical protein
MKNCIPLLFVFFLSIIVRPQDAIFDLRTQSKNPYPLQYGLIAPAPLFGKYQTPYLFFNRIIIPIDTSVLLAYAPQQLLTIFTKFDASHTIFSQICFYVEHIDKIPLNEPINFVSHPFVRMTVNNDYFQDNVSIGIFSADGVSLSKDLGDNTLKLMPVSVHGPGTAFSPNNGLFSLNTGRSIATFWSIMHDKAWVSITYHIIASNTQNSLGKMITDILITSLTQQSEWQTYYQQYRNLPIARLYTKQDVACWKNSTLTVDSIFLPNSLNHLENTLNILINNLKVINNSL